MSTKNLGNLLKDVTDILVSEEKTGEKEAKRKALEMVKPQVFVQSKKELKLMFQPLKVSQESTLKNGEPFTVPPIISLSDEEILTVFEKVFDGYNTLGTTFNQKSDTKSPKGDNGLPLTPELYHAMVKHTQDNYAKPTTDFFVKPVLNLKRVQQEITNPFGKAIADAELKKRGMSRTDGSEKDKLAAAKERGYITSRITGHQSPKVPTKLPGQDSVYMTYRDEGLTEFEKSSGMQLGHGEAGIPTFMHKVLELETYLKENPDIPTEVRNDIETIIIDMKEEYKPTLKYMENISFDKGLTKIYKFLIITGQSTLSNMMDNQQKEKDIAEKLKEKHIAFQEKHHDSVLRKTIGNLLIHRLVSKQGKRIKLGSKKFKPIARSKEKATIIGKKVSFKKNIRVALIRQKFYDLKKVTAVGLTKTKKNLKRKKATPAASSVSTTGSPLHLLAMFNAKLEQNIKDNMGGAALHNRTGRFAESVKAVNIVPVPGTTGTIQYSYMRDPYGVFERDGMRDPRLLIDNTLREMAAEMALGRFTTQRV